MKKRKEKNKYYIFTSDLLNPIKLKRFRLQRTLFLLYIYLLCIINICENIAKQFQFFIDRHINAIYQWLFWTLFSLSNVFIFQFYFFVDCSNYVIFPLDTSVVHKVRKRNSSFIFKLHLLRSFFFLFYIYYFAFHSTQIMSVVVVGKVSTIEIVVK